MTWYYSASERSFFTTDLMTTGSMPSDRVAVADDVYEQLMADQVAGKLIRPGSGNVPESANQNLTAASRFGDVSFGKVTCTALDLNGAADISGTLVVGGTTTLKGALAAQAGITATTITATGTTTLAALNATNITASGTLKVNGQSTLAAVSATNVSASGTLTVNGNSTLKALSATNISASGTLKVTGATTLTRKLTANGGVDTKAITATTLTTSGNATIGGLLAVTGAASLNGGGTVKTPTANVDDTSIINAAWAWDLIQSYGLGAGLNTSPSISTALNDIDTTGFYTLSGTFTDGPSGFSTISAQLLHMERRFAAGTTGFQLLPFSNQIFYRTRNQDTWGGWSTVATQDWTKGQIDALTTLTDDGVSVLGSPAYNSITDPGFYHCNSTNAANGPGYAAKMIVLTTKAADPKHVTQVAFPIANAALDCPAFRGMNANGDWTEWRKIALIDSEERFVMGDMIELVSGATRGVNPSTVQWSMIAFRDAERVVDEGSRLGLVGHRAGTDGTVRVRLACYEPKKGTNASAAIDVGYDASGNIFTSAPVPPTNANGNHIVTAGWANDRFLQLTGGGMTGNLYVTDSGLRVQSNVIELGVTPKSNQFMYIPFYDKNGVDNIENRLACLQYAARTSGESDISFFMRNPANSNQSAGYYARWKADGTTRYWLGHSTPEDAEDNDVATASYVKKIGGSYWGLGNNAPSVSAREGWSTLVDVDKTGFYSVGNSNGQKVVGTVLHIQRQWEAGANGFQLNFGANNTICVRSRDMSYTAEWNDWVQLADQDWVMDHLSSAIPPGAVMFFAQGSLPDGWLICNGANVSRTTYANLFAAIGTKYGSGNGSTTFTLPNLNAKFVEGTTTTSSVGQTVSAGLPNITGEIGYDNNVRHLVGAFYAASGSLEGNASGNGGQVAGFDASRVSSVYGASSTVQPPAVKLLPCIKF